MTNTIHFWVGLLMLSVAAVVTFLLGSYLQHRAIAQQQVTRAVYAAEMTASVLPPAYRNASF